MTNETLNRANKVVPIDPRQAELAARVAQGAPLDGVFQLDTVPLAFIRASEVTQPIPAVYKPCLCVVVQGRKRTIIGQQSFYYDAFNYLIVSVMLPMLGQIVEASPDHPYLCLRIDIDLADVAKLLLELPKQHIAVADSRPLCIARTSTELLDVILRLLRLLDTPDDLPVLAPLALHEIWYRVLRSEMASQLLSLLDSDAPTQRIRRAVELLQQHFHEPLRVEDLAEAAHMSLSSFHARFKAMTALSPLQFQKHLRLHEARRLMISEGMEAAVAAHQVGYESASQFSREYRRLFGLPPRQEIAAKRAL